MPKKLYPCMLCEKRYAEIEDAEVCEQSHAQAQARAAENLWAALRKSLQDYPSTKKDRPHADATE